MSDREEAIAGIRRGLEEMAAGRGQPLDVAFANLRRELGIPSDGDHAAVRGNSEDGEIEPPPFVGHRKGGLTYFSQNNWYPLGD